MVISLRSSYFLLIIKGNFNLFLETKKFRYPKNSGCPSERVSHLLLIWRLFKRVLYRLGWLILFMKVDIFVSSVLISNVLRNHLNLSSRIVLRSFEEQENCASFSVVTGERLEYTIAWLLGWRLHRPSPKINASKVFMIWIKVFGLILIIYESPLTLLFNNFLKFHITRVH
jgi:hypothetical protein